MKSRCFFLIPFAFLWAAGNPLALRSQKRAMAMMWTAVHGLGAIKCVGVEVYDDVTNTHHKHNMSRSTVAGIEAYRSALTLDADDQRQREFLAVFVPQVPAPSRAISSDCIAHPRPSTGKVARLMLELLKNLEGDESTVVTDLIRALVRSKMLVETSSLESEPDFDALIKTPGVMVGEPHITFPRILAVAWMSVADPVTTKKYGWCPLQKLNKYLTTSKPATIAKQMRNLEPILTRARYIMEEFIQHVIPLNIYDRKSTKPVEHVAAHEGVSRTFRRLIISTRAAKSTTSILPYITPEVELSRAGVSYQNSLLEPNQSKAVNVQSQENRVVLPNNVSSLIVRQSVLLIYFILFLLL